MKGTIVNTYRVFTTIMGIGTCAALAWGSVQVSTWPPGSPAALAGVMGLWAAAGVLSFIFIRAAGNGAWPATVFFVVLYAGAGLAALAANFPPAFAYGPILMLWPGVVFSLGLEAGSPTPRSPGEPAPPQTRAGGKG
jgi:hypothetical protein